MIIKNTIKKDITVKQSYVDEDKNLIDAETGETIDLVDVIQKIYGENEVKIAITASTTEEVEYTSDSE